MTGDGVFTYARLEPHLILLVAGLKLDFIGADFRVNWERKFASYGIDGHPRLEIVDAAQHQVYTFVFKATMSEKLSLPLFTAKQMDKNHAHLIRSTSVLKCSIVVTLTL